MKNLDMKRCFDEIDSFASKRAKRSRDDLLQQMRSWCLEKNVTLSEKVTFGPGCAGHGLLATGDIEEGEELARISRSATLHHSPRLEKAFKINSKIKNHPWISVKG